MALVRCEDLDRVAAFCAGQPVRYRYILHALGSPCPEWDMALGDADPDHAEFYLDSPTRPALVASLLDGVLQIEGDVAAAQRQALVDWCRQVAPCQVITTHTPLQHLLSDAFALGPTDWRQNGEYTATQESFSPRLTRPVLRLTRADRPLWQRFVARHEQDPIMGPVVRDLTLMDSGLPVRLYATQSEADAELTGVLSVVPYTATCDEIATVFVQPEYRRRGNAHSMLSEATYEMLRQGRQPGYSAAGNRPELISLLAAVGYVFITLTWYAEVG